MKGGIRMNERMKKLLRIVYSIAMAVLGFFGAFGIWSFGVYMYIQHCGAIVLSYDQWMVMEVAKYIWMGSAAIATFAATLKLAKWGIR